MNPNGGNQPTVPATPDTAQPAVYNAVMAHAEVEQNPMPPVDGIAPPAPVPEAALPPVTPAPELVPIRPSVSEPTLSVSTPEVTPAPPVVEAVVPVPPTAIVLPPSVAAPVAEPVVPDHETPEPHARPIVRPDDLEDPRSTAFDIEHVVGIGKDA